MNPTFSIANEKRLSNTMVNSFTLKTDNHGIVHSSVVRERVCFKTVQGIEDLLKPFQRFSNFLF